MGWNFYNASGELQINDGGVSATAASITNDLTVTSGNVVIATAGKGIDFSAQTPTSASGATTTAELLNHYEEGTWTPTIGGNTSYTVQQGRYTKIGRTVTIAGSLTINTLGTGSTTVVSGLPFTAAAFTNNFAGTCGYFANITSSTTMLTCSIAGGAVTLEMIGQATTDQTANPSFIVWANSVRIDFAVEYIV